MKALQANLINCVRVNHEVTQIQWTACDDSETMNGHHPVKVVCGNGNSFEADHVILTVSLGVLKEKHSSLFCPPLSKDKINAIQHLGFGYVGKIFLEFEERFWSWEEYHIHVVLTDNAKNEVDDVEHQLNRVEWMQKCRNVELSLQGTPTFFIFHSSSWVECFDGLVSRQ